MSYAWPFHQNRCEIILRIIIHLVHFSYKTVFIVSGRKNSEAVLNKSSFFYVFTPRLVFHELPGYFDYVALMSSYVCMYSTFQSVHCSRYETLISVCSSSRIQCCFVNWKEHTHLLPVSRIKSRLKEQGYLKMFA